MDFQVSRSKLCNKLCILLLASLLIIGVLHSTRVCASDGGSVAWYYEDTITGGDWYFNPIGSPINKYGSYAHILPNPNGTGQIPIGSFSVPMGFDLSNSSTWPLLGDPPYNWTSLQIAGLLKYNSTWPLLLNSPYWDEYVTQIPPVTYYVNGTEFTVNSSFTIYYPVFEYNWTAWDTIQTDHRQVYYTGLTGCGPGPGGWFYASWDDGGERCQPERGYMNFTLHFPMGVYLLSLYAYDFERGQRDSQEYRIYNEAGMLLAVKRINGTKFDEGVYEIFRVFAPPAGLTIIVQVYNDGVHHADPLVGTYNVVLSGIFVDPLPSTGGFLFPIDNCARAHELLEPLYLCIGLSLTLIVPSMLIVYVKQRKKKQT